MADDGEDLEVTKDMLASLAGVAVSEACGGPKKIASAASVDPSNGRRWARGERSNPVYRTLGILQNASDPWPMVALFAAQAARALLKAEGPMPEWKWRAAYLEACRDEQAHDGAEDCVQTALLSGKASIADQFQADRKMIASTMRRLALGYIGMTEGFELNPPKAH